MQVGIGTVSEGPPRKTEDGVAAVSTCVLVRLGLQLGATNQIQRLTSNRKSLAGAYASQSRQRQVLRDTVNLMPRE